MYLQLEVFQKSMLVVILVNLIFCMIVNFVSQQGNIHQLEAFVFPSNLHTIAKAVQQIFNTFFSKIKTNF